jgi:hypothetical protein
MYAYAAKKWHSLCPNVKKKKPAAEEIQKTLNSQGKSKHQKTMAPLPRSAIFIC